MPFPLVTSAWLEQHLSDSDLRIIELRGKVLPPTAPPPHYISDRAGFDAAHIPGAVYVDWQIDIVEPGSPSNDIAAPQRFADLMERLGISNSSPIVVCDDAGSMFACRMWWALRYYGHAEVRILDGGWTKWRDDARPVNDIPANYTRGNYTARVNESLRATTRDILKGLQAGSVQLVDVRSPAEYAGESSRARHGGHIPSAVNLPRNAMVNRDMTLKSEDNLRALFQDAGIDLNAPDTVLYCNSGVSATYGMLAMQVAGARNLRLYDGSWKEWGNDESTPKET